jgi:hypothetical protein
MATVSADKLTDIGASTPIWSCALKLQLFENAIYALVDVHLSPLYYPSPVRLKDLKVQCIRGNLRLVHVIHQLQHDGYSVILDCCKLPGKVTTFRSE